MKNLLFIFIFTCQPMYSYCNLSIRQLINELKPLENTYSFECSKTIDFQDSMSFKTCVTNCLGYNIYIGDFFDFGNKYYLKNLNNITIILNDSTTLRIVNFFSESDDKEIVLMDSNFFPSSSYLVDSDYNLLMVSEYGRNDENIIEKTYRAMKFNLFEFNLEDLNINDYKITNICRYYSKVSYMSLMTRILCLFE